MAGNEREGRRGGIARYTFGGALCLLAGINLLIGSHWYLCLGIAAGAGMIILGHGRIFRAGVNRSLDEIVCHYVPWYEGNAYFLCLLLPLLGVASLAAGYAPGNPVWLRFVGGLLLGITPLCAFFIWRMRRRCFLRITSSALAMQLAGRGSEVTEIRREYVDSIDPKMAPIGAFQSLQVAVTYRPADSSTGSTKTVMLGPPPGPEAVQVSVQPVNLFNALVAWKEAANETPRALLDRIERILRGRETAGV